MLSNVRLDYIVYRRPQPGESKQIIKVLSNGEVLFVLPSHMTDEEVEMIIKIFKSAYKLGVNDGMQALSDNIRTLLDTVSD